jgi:cytoskeletal protein CcmA (bactofilin family)
MLKRTPQDETFKESPPSVISPVSPESHTIIGENITIEGGIRGKENLVIEGSVKGNIELEANHLTVGAKGHVEGEIQAEGVTVQGRLTGNIKASGKVKITKEADFSGEIRARSISVEDGAMLKAVIELERESQIKAVPKPKAKPVEQSSPVSQDGPTSAMSEGVKGSHS